MRRKKLIAEQRKNRPHFNAVDAMIIILVIVAVLGVYFRYNILDVLSQKQDEKDYYVSFSIENIRYTTPNYIRVNDTFYLKADGKYLGKLVSESENQEALNIVPAVEYFTDSEGHIVPVSYPDMESRVNVKGRLLCTGTYSSEGGFCLGGNTYLSAGQSIDVYSDSVTVTMKISSIEVVES